ncbi:NAD-dependent epimerase [Longispora fulva]|uniref:Nucleoside-diphosphate-sugar epimerase n=1 Tax=Longispora fulva TaxID=619741 RepID=A0A8J7GLZ9_9ACTN|nr:NAD-dependent epimerase/dehydratase family protein [Longispora fulva]MBG6135494.1 nucleoside-diphosphate-sugar epimerase [Longispora fulva]GIG56266.1 NAD-dependent epimerase [Longispora fulva]
MHVIIGAGAVGSTVATQLAARGEQVRILSRRGSGPEHPAIERVAADATDASRLSALSAGAVALYNCASPEYHRWLTDWPPIATAILTAAERTGAVLATTSNLYGYGPVTGPITPATTLAATHPKLRLRAQMWRDALALHQAGRIRATEVRGSDYIEANSIFSYVARPVRAGKRAQVPTPLDVPHSWTSIADVARTLIAAAGDERAWGQGWLVPTHAPMTVRELTTRFAKVIGAPEPRLRQLPWPVLWTMGLFSPVIRELRATRYQFVRPFVIDSDLTERTFGLSPTDLDDALLVA